MKILYTFIFSILIVFPVFGQNQNNTPNSVYNKKFQKVKALSLHSIDSALLFAEELLEVCTNENDSTQIEAYFLVAKLYQSKGNFEKTTDLITKSKQLSSSLDADNRKTITGRISLFNGSIAMNKGDYPEALGHFQNSQITFSETYDSSLLAQAYSKIGLVNYYLYKDSLALEYYEKALNIHKELNNQSGISIQLFNIGNLMQESGNYEEAIENYLISLDIEQKLNNKEGQAFSYNNIARVFILQKKYKDALEFNNYNLELSRDLGKVRNILYALHNSADIKLNLNDIEGSRKDILEAKKIAIEVNDTEMISWAYKHLSTLEEHNKNYEEALRFEKLFRLYNDSVNNQKMEIEFTEVEAKFLSNQKQKEINSKDALLSKNEIELKLHQTEIANQNFQRNIFIGGFLIVLFAAILFLRVFLQKKKANSLLNLQKIEIEEKNQLVEEKNKELVDSINYAERIQQALLKTEEHVSDHLPPHFILFKPKDIVSGDFYWAIEQGNFLYLAVSDCTGHGVPGAFMSMLGIAYLNEITSAQQLLSPAEILNQLRDKVIFQLGQKGNFDDNKDGMDISLIKFNLKDYKAEWAGANNPIYIVRNGELKEIKANKQPIGQFRNKKLFDNHSIQFQKNDSFYLFSDGYPDQFGGPKGKKLKYRAMKNILINNYNKDVGIQKEQLDTYFEDWKQDTEQIDDVCIIGVNII